MGLEGGYSSCRMHYYALSFQRSFSNHTFFFHQESGKDSQDKKRNHIKGLLVAATDCEPQYITRLLQVTHFNVPGVHEYTVVFASA